MYTTLIDTTSLLERHLDPDWLVFDVRYDLADKSAGKAAYQKDHIPGAVYVDLHEDLSRPPSTNNGRHPLPTSEVMNELFSELGIQETSQVVIYDNVFGAFAARLWWMLRHMQHKNVAVLDGGWQAWTAAGAPTDSEQVNRNKSQFNNTAIPDDVVFIEDVQDARLVIDSREPIRYSGGSEPIDKAAGHIPGALNRFWKENISETGCFREKAHLKQEFAQLLGQVPAESSVFYCGSGVTACHNLLAAVHAGLPQPKLYAGSWSEWSSTPNKPIATGN